jgi:hypothetical protein
MAVLPPGSISKERWVRHRDLVWQMEALIKPVHEHAAEDPRPAGLVVVFKAADTHVKLAGEDSDSVDPVDVAIRGVAEPIGTGTGLIDLLGANLAPAGRERPEHAAYAFAAERG